MIFCWVKHEQYATVSLKCFVARIPDLYEVMGCETLWREAWDLNAKQMAVWWIPSTSQSRAKPITAMCLLCFYASVCKSCRDYSNEQWDSCGLIFTDFRAYLYGHSYLKPRIHHLNNFNVGRKQYSVKFLAEEVHINVRRLSKLTSFCFVIWSPDFKSEPEDRLPWLKFFSLSQVLPTTLRNLSQASFLPVHCLPIIVFEWNHDDVFINVIQY